jgi:hypothetical protein
MKARLHLLSLLPIITAAAASPFSTSFSCAISTITLRGGDAPYEVCTIAAGGASGGTVSTQWVTGTFGAVGEGMEATLISFYIDGEAAPSLTVRRALPRRLTGTELTRTRVRARSPLARPLSARSFSPSS